MRKRISILIAVLTLLFIFAGCSGGTQSTLDQAEINQLKTENEKLRAELETVLAKLETTELKVENISKELNTAIASVTAAENKIVKLESELSAVNAKLAAVQEKLAAQPTQGGQTTQTGTEPTQINIVPPESDPNKSLIGEWFYQTFKEDGSFSYAQSMIFKTGGTGSISRTYYVPRSDVQSIQEMINMGVGFENLDTSNKFSWSLSGNTVHIVLDNGETADFTLSLEEQKLTQVTQRNNPQIYAREKPAGMEQYIERSLLAKDSKAKQEVLLRKFLGTWYYDVLTWTFNEDGTGIIDIPEIGEHPASTKEFTYTISGNANDPTYLCLIIDWDDYETSYYYPTFNADGSMLLKGIGSSDPIKFTRTFDITNCPISEAIIKGIYNVISGSFIYDFLPE